MERMHARLLRLKTVKLFLVLSTALACFLFGLAGCGGNVSDDKSNFPLDAEARTTTVSWDANADCSTCHVEEACSQTDITYLYAKHPGMDCITCHSDVDALANVHADGETDVSKAKLKKTDVSRAICVSCHDSSELVETSASCEVLTDDNGTTVNPHALPENEDHEKVVCVDCHEFHAADYDVTETALAFCTSCHHAGVFECNTCHSA